VCGEPKKRKSTERELPGYFSFEREKEDEGQQSVFWF